MAIALCLMCAANVFSENYYWEKVDLIATEYLSDGEYLICFDTPELTLVENPTMDDRSVMNLKSSDSLKQEVKTNFY